MGEEEAGTAQPCSAAYMGFSGNQRQIALLVRTWQLSVEVAIFRLQVCHNLFFSFVAVDLHVSATSRQLRCGVLLSIILERF